MKVVEAPALRLAAVVRSSDDAIVSKDLNGIIESWNPAAERMFGFTAAEAVGQSITMIIPDDRLEEETLVLSRIRQGLAVEHFETVRRHKSGRLVEISLTVSPIKDEDGRIIGASKIARDISEQRRLMRELEEASRLKDEFLATLSHELRTPLNAIMGYARMLMSNSIGEPNRKRAIELIDRNAQVLARLVSDVLDVSRIIAGKTSLNVKRCNLTKVIAASIDVVRHALDAKQLELAWDPGSSPVVLTADPDRLQQVFWNLLANAVKFTPEGGRVAVRIVPSESLVSVIVEDTGIGIPPDFLPSVFQRFRQADTTVLRESGGLGLGLAIVRHFVELHGGSVRAASDGIGRGSTFTVTLPRRPFDQAHSPKKSRRKTQR
jgi:PAS domain S-box-containing protein